MGWTLLRCSPPKGDKHGFSLLGLGLLGVNLGALFLLARAVKREAQENWGR